MALLAESRSARTGDRVDPAGDLALRDLYEREYLPLVRLASLLLDDRGSCEEVVQDAFVRALAAWGTIRDPAKAPAFLRSAVLNGARSRLRRRLVVLRHPPDPARAVTSPEGATVRHQLVIGELRRLPTRQREALALRYFLDLSEAEIADTLGISAGSVKTHVHRGLETLARRLEGSR